VLSAAEPDVAGEGCPGSGDGDVGDEQSGQAFAFPVRGGRVVEDGREVGGQLADAGLLGVGERVGGGVFGGVVGVLRGVEVAEGGVPVGFEGVGDEPVGGVDGEVAAAGQVGVVAARSTAAARSWSAASAR
jgi:hypothetical protein